MGVLGIKPRTLEEQTFALILWLGVLAVYFFCNNDVEHGQDKKASYFQVQEERVLIILVYFVWRVSHVLWLRSGCVSHWDTLQGLH